MYCAVEEQTKAAASRFFNKRTCSRTGAIGNIEYSSTDPFAGPVCALLRASNGRRFWSAGFVPGHQTKPEMEALVRNGTASPQASSSHHTFGKHVNFDMQNEGQEPVVRGPSPEQPERHGSFAIAFETTAGCLRPRTK
jgi:hypothetical protein